jgi:hypothetical protein
MCFLYKLKVFLMIEETFFFSFYFSFSIPNSHETYVIGNLKKMKSSRHKTVGNRNLLILSSEEIRDILF